MTILAAAIGPDGTWLGCDGYSVSTAGCVKSPAMKKWNISPDRLWAFAAAGEITFDTVVLRDTQDLWPKATERQKGGYTELLEQVHDERAAFAQRMRMKLLAVDGVQLIRDDDCFFGDFRISPLIVTPGFAWRLCSDLCSFDEPIDGVYHVEGAGADFAAGAMSALLAHGVTSAEELVKGGVAAACRSSVYCGGEMFFDNLGIDR